MKIEEVITLLTELGQLPPPVGTGALRKSFIDARESVERLQDENISLRKTVALYRNKSESRYS